MNENDKLNILWTTDNKDTIFNMLSMYVINSKNRGWWETYKCNPLGSIGKISGKRYTSSDRSIGNATIRNYN